MTTRHSATVCSDQATPGTLRLGDLSVGRLGFGGMRITGRGVSGSRSLPTFHMATPRACASSTANPSTSLMRSVQAVPPCRPSLTGSNRSMPMRTNCRTRLTDDSARSRRRLRHSRNVPLSTILPRPRAPAYSSASTAREITGSIGATSVQKMSRLSSRSRVMAAMLPAATDPAGAIQGAVITIGRNGFSEPQNEADEDDGIKPLSERLITQLTAHRALALREALARILPSEPGNSPASLRGHASVSHLLQ